MRQTTARRAISLFQGSSRLRVVAALAAASPIVLPLLSPRGAVAQVNEVVIAYPQPNSVLKGATKVLFNGIPDGGHVAIYIDLTPTNRAQSFREATKLGSFLLDTSALSDGPHTMTIIAFGATGRQVSQKTVPFRVANEGSAGVAEDSVRLLNWTPQDVINPKVQRYRVFAISDATIVDGSSSSDSGSGSGGSSEPETTEAPLDKQVDLFIRRTVRDVAMLEKSANIRLIVQEAFERGRQDSESKSGGGSSTRKKKYVGKAPWGNWLKAPESSQAYTKMILQNGREINATRKPATLPLGDILPEFPSYRVQPGATWDGDLTIVGELTQRVPIRLKGVPLAFSGFDNIQTPAGIERRAAKIEIASFSLPDDVAMKIARALQTEAGGSSSSSGSSSGSSSSGSSGSGGESEPAEITVARSDMTRTLWFDIASNQLLRSEDVVNTYYEEEEESESSSSSSNSTSSSDSSSSSSSSGSGSEAATPAVPKSVTYNLRVVKFLDDRLPNPTNTYNGGLGTAHSRDSVRDPSLSKANGNLVNNR